MDNVNVTGLTRVRDAKPNKGGSTVIAYFDCEARGLEFIGCAFVRTPKNGLTVWLPKIETPQPGRRAVNFTDDSLRHAMMIQARETYRALGGTDAEWVGRTASMGPRPDDDDEQPALVTSRPGPIELPDVLPPALKRTIIPVTRRTVETGNEPETLK